MANEEEFVEEPEEFLEEDHPHSADEHSVSVAVGDETADVYTQEGRDELEESEEIAAWEEGFAQGADQGGQDGSCAHCDAPLGDADSVVESEIKGKVFRFCCAKCAQSGPKSH